MQERYCECGQKITVQFAPQENAWKALFWSILSYSGERVFRCPQCQRDLTIDKLS